MHRSLKQLEKYYSTTASKTVRDSLKAAVLADEFRSRAVDCGCGAGSDIEFLLSKGYEVFGYDNEDLALEMLSVRFKDNESVKVQKSTFWDFDYPEASLIVADASLFFCPSDKLALSIAKMISALRPGGIILATFLGEQDSMLENDPNVHCWPYAVANHEKEIRKYFEKLETLSFDEIRCSGASAERDINNWHIYSLLAKKPFNMC